MPRINNLKIRKLGNVAPGTELKFGPRGVILLGKNGTGKTTLLNSIVSICNLDLQSLHEDYDIEFSLICGDDVELRVTARCAQSAASSRAEPAADPIAQAMRSVLQRSARRHTLDIEALNHGSGERIRVESDDNQSKWTLPNGDHVDHPIVASGDWRVLAPSAMFEGAAWLWSSVVEIILSSNNLRRFDEGLDYFGYLTEPGPGSVNIESTGGAALLNLLQTRLISRDCARLLLESVEEPGNENRSGFCDSGEIKYLEMFCRLTGFEQARIEADLDERHQFQERAVVSLSPLRFTMKRDGSMLHHRHLSFGERRLLAFLHYHASTPTLLVADELVNGMHHEWISRSIRLMHGAQAFLSSQNPLLFDFLTFDSAEDVASRFVSCDLDEQHRFVWRNMSDSDAVEFYETYKVGLQHVSEILRTRGYW